MLLARIHHRDTAHFCRLQGLFGKGHRIFVVLDDVDLLAAQFADNGLHTHAFHAHACTYRVHIFVFRHNGDLGALAGLARDGTDDYRPIVNFGDFGLEQVLHQFGRAA